MKKKLLVLLMLGLLGVQPLGNVVSATQINQSGTEETDSSEVNESSSIRATSSEVTADTSQESTQSSTLESTVETSNSETTGSSTTVAEESLAIEETVAVETEQVAIPTIQYQVATDGQWQTKVMAGQPAGGESTTNQLTGFKINELVDGEGNSAAFEYRSHITNVGWETSYHTNGGISGGNNVNNPLEAIQVRLSGESAANYDVYYQVYCQNGGWLDWAKNDQVAGMTGLNNKISALKIQLVQKNQPAPGNTEFPGGQFNFGKLVETKAHVTNIGWQSNVNNGGIAGTVGRALNLEAYQIKNNSGIPGQIQYTSHIASIGWEGINHIDGQTSGTTGRNLPVEAVKMNLSGRLNDIFDIYYRVQTRNLGWLSWAKNGEGSGTSNFALSVEAIQIQLVLKNGQRPVTSGQKSAYYDGTFNPGLSYMGHSTNVGWQGAVGNGGVAGTTGRNFSLQALAVNFNSDNLNSNISYRAHVSKIGWQDFTTNGGITGTTGRNLAIEAMQISLKGPISYLYDIYYRVHTQNIGWMGWAKNGGYAGTSAWGLNVEAIQIRLIKKGDVAPGSTDRSYLVGSVMLNVPYVSQLAAGAPMGCEGAAMMQAYRYKGKMRNRSLVSLLHEMPISPNNNPNNGFVGSPFNVTQGIYQTIFAGPFTSWANRYGLAKNITGANLSTLKDELRAGNPIVVWVTIGMNPPRYEHYFFGKVVSNLHVCTLDGFDEATQRFHIMDPYAGSYWVSRQVFESSYNFFKQAVSIRE